MTTKVVNIRAGGHFDVYIGRGQGSIFGNPFSVGKSGDRHQVIENFRTYFRKRMDSDPAFKAEVLTLKGRVLG